VYEYQVKQNPDAAEKLLKQLEPYYRKFVRLLKRGIYDPSDLDIRLFLGLYIEDPDERKLFYSSWHTNEGHKIGNSRASFLSHVCRYISYEELEQECRLIILVLADRYKKMDSSFLGYLNTAFRFELRRSLEVMAMDPLIFAAQWNISYDDTEYDNPDSDFTIMDDALIFEEDAFTMDYTELGPTWYQGLTCSEIFKDLSPTDRKILKLYYLDGLSDQEIADRIGLTRSWINQRRREAVNMLKNKMK
jgi:RNA polymerase sigma factor (sigma-70 family)